MSDNYAKVGDGVLRLAASGADYISIRLTADVPRSAVLVVYEEGEDEGGAMRYRVMAKVKIVTEAYRK